ncbi:MAG TPA: NUMOD4 domain-containing protein [Negativicutes bacterium]|nr:NUMOD4 domain-containing protein [Negativicutes bacterium]
MEIWKDIKGYEGLYQVSNLGNVRSLKNCIVLVGAKNTQYKTVSLCRNGVCVTNFRHRLVAEAFIPNLLNKRQVNHKDGNKHNNNVENLEWVTHKENMKHAYENNMRDFKEARPVLQYDLSGDLVNEYKTIHDAEKAGFNHSHIISCCVGRRNEHGGYVWIYKEDVGTIEKRIYRANHKLTIGKPVVQMDLDGNEIAKFNSATEPEGCGFLHAKIIACCRGQRNTHGGYKWKYAI